MSQFEFFMGFYGLLLGLGLAELLVGFSNLLRERTPPRPGRVIPLLGVIAVIEIMATFIDAWTSLRGIEIRMAQLAVPMLIGLTYFVLAVVMVPRHLEDWSNLDDHFDQRRTWIVGLFIAANLLVILTEIPGLIELVRGGKWAPLASYGLRNAWLMGGYAVLLFSRRRWLDIAAALAVVLFYVFNYVLYRNDALLAAVFGQ
jgi:hypothetical protein